MKAKEFIIEVKTKDAIKPRNFVAKNAPKAGAGAHKDKKRAEKQGDVKHKNKFNYKQDNWSQDFERRMKQGVEEGVFDMFKSKPLPKEPETIKLGKFEVELTPGNKYIGFAWKDSNGKEHYEEVSTRGEEFGANNRNELISKIKDEIKYQEKQIKQGVAEGMFGLSNKEKAKIQYVTAKISDIPGNWDHKNQTYTERGLADLKSVMKNEKYLKYALSLTADDYEAEGVAEEVVSEKAVSKQQQKFMGMVHAAKKGETPASPEVAKVAAGMSKKAAKDFAATKHKGLPKKKGVSEDANINRKVFKKNGKPVGEVGMDLDASPGQGDWYVKHYASGTDLSGYDSYAEAVEELRHLVQQDVSEDQVSEVSKDYAEKIRAAEQIAKILDSNKGSNWGDHSLDDLKQIQQLAKITGRRYGVWQSKKLGREMKVGSIIDLMSKYVQQKQRDSGEMPEFTGRAPTAKAMAQQIALQTNGDATWRHGTTWTSGRTGQRHRDPQDYVDYGSDKTAFDDAWSWIESKGKKVHYKDNFGDLKTAVKIGSYIVQPSTRTRGPFSNNPSTEYSVSVRTVKSLNQPTRTVQDITDQQAAAIRDIANTKSDNAMKMIKALIDVLDGERDVQKVIDQSEKIDPKDKAKLDKIIASAKDFKESFNRPVNEISYGDVKFKVGNWTYDAYEEDEGDVRKMYHSAIGPDGKTYDIDYSPYDVMDKETFKMWVKTGMPTRKTFNSNGPVEKEDIMKLAQAKGIATLDREMARAGMKDE